MKQLAFWFPLVILALVPARLSAQETKPPAAHPGQPPMPDTAAIKAVMAPIVPQAGCWRGEGWMQMGRGVRSRSRGEELVTARLGGTLVTIAGHFRALADDGMEGAVIHEAFGTLSPNPAGGLKLSAFLATGLSGEFQAQFAAGKLTWSPPAMPGREIRYIADWSVADRWHEIGEISINGGPWTQFMEMTLTRQSARSACPATSAAE